MVISRQPSNLSSASLDTKVYWKSIMLCKKGLKKFLSWPTCMTFQTKLLKGQIANSIFFAIYSAFKACEWYETLVLQ